MTKKSTLTGIVGLTTTAVAALALAVPGTAQAAATSYWIGDCDKWAADGDPGANDMVATLRRSSDAAKHAYASFKGYGETLYFYNKAGASMNFRVDIANGSTHERAWDRTLGTGQSENMDFDIAEGRTVYLRIGTPGGDDTAFCQGKA
ncbi:hypothetical protein ACIQ1J_21110 [Streptomyces sp. NPDC097107]|uniref:hypothetical protein n=1 Tax=Streptomyces sp. NPDC097107 TaxID=3366089 RepID=UPI003823635D